MHGWRYLYGSPGIIIYLNLSLLIYIIVSCYNEEEVLPQSTEKLRNLLKRLHQETEVEGRLLFVDDGSGDRTWAIIEELSRKYDDISGIKLSHNRGHQVALWAGIQETAGRCDAIISIDADLQDDENAIMEMAKLFVGGADLVYGVRKMRDIDTFFKRFSAETFYKLMHTVDKRMLYNHADFRLMSARAVDALMEYGERNLFFTWAYQTTGGRLTPALQTPNRKES